MSQTSTGLPENTIKTWWQTTASHTQDFLNVMQSGQYITDNKINSAINYCDKRIHELNSTGCPPDALHIQEQLLESLTNFRQSLYYQGDNNSYHAQTRRDMAQNNLDMMRFYLLQHNILLS